MSDDWVRRLDEMRRDLELSGDPVAWVSETAAAKASLRYPSLAVRGSLFGACEPAARRSLGG
ncbi:DUF5954 family protein [Streptomyces sp. NPDC056191]|uniref:DUF5954 family protein n=1 Tax=Streptomyces sp. NPDC056191 TaxID=3345742 RepID=UPI0035DE15FE